MKKLVLTISLLAGATCAYSQGQLNWSDYVTGFSMSIYSPNPASPSVEQNLGNTPGDIPAGTATYGGTLLAGTGYSVGLYLDTTQTAVQSDVLNGTPIATDTFAAGQGGWDFSGSLVATDPTLPSGTAVYVELAAWANTGTAGAANSYAAALADGYATGLSSVSSSTTSLGGGGSPPAVPGSLVGIGLTDFSLATTPEPSTIALGVIGASAFLMRLRRKQ